VVLSVKPQILSKVLDQIARRDRSGGAGDLDRHAITGLHTLENGGVRTTLMNAVEAATRRSRELGEALLRRNGAP
jgi:pyrroline-5-carboxylate reductase